MTLPPECLIYWASGDFLSGIDTEIDTESRRYNSEKRYDSDNEKGCGRQAGLLSEFRCQGTD